MLAYRIQLDLITFPFESCISRNKCAQVQPWLLIYHHIYSFGSNLALIVGVTI